MSPVLASPKREYSGRQPETFSISNASDREMGARRRKLNAQKPAISGLFANSPENPENIALRGCHGEDRTAVFPIEKSPLKYRVNFSPFREIRERRFLQLVHAVRFNAPLTRTAAIASSR
jgi:hypothetical protein